MLEVEGDGEEDGDLQSDDVIDRRPASNPGGSDTSGTPDPDPGHATPPVDHCAIPPVNHIGDTVKPSPIEEDLRLHCLPDWSSHNNNSVRHATGVKPEAEVTSPSVGGESRTTEVATALAGVHSVLERISDVSERQHVIGDVIVHLQVLRCRLQLAQVPANHDDDNIICSPVDICNISATFEQSG